LEAVGELNRTDPGWQLEHLEARRRVVPPARNSALKIEAARRLLPANWKGGYRPPDGPLSKEQLAAIQNQRKRAAAALAEARALIDYSEGRHKINYSRDALSTLLPHCQDIGLVIDLLSLDAFGQLLDGRPAEAINDCRAAVNAAWSLDDEPISISQFTRMAGIATAVQDAERVLRFGDAPSAELEALQRLLDAEVEEPILQTMARGERGAAHWVMQGVTSGDLETKAGPEIQKANPDLAAALNALPQGLAARHVHAWLLRHLTRFVDISRLPDPRQRDAIRQWDRDAHAAPPGALTLLVAGPKLVDACLRYRGRLRCAVVMLALERYRLKYDRWPDQLADLKPDFLQYVPSDPIDGRPLRYLRTPDGVTVYAIGLDGTDHGGAMEDWPQQVRDDSNVGFRLLDPAKRHKLMAK
jgi:hypothetical protein